MTTPTRQEEIWSFVKLAIVIAVGVLLVYFILAATGDGGEYTRADCIQQWRDSGMLGNVDVMCSEYP